MRRFVICLIALFITCGNIQMAKTEDNLNIDGSKYANQREWPTIKAEYEIYIKGTTLIWRMCFVWAKPDVTLPRPLGVWVDLGQAQIIGREAHIYLQNPVPDDVIFTVSENGNSITEQEKSGTYIFRRVSSPVNEQAEASATSTAYVESRGEFYVLTKDGRKISGEEAKNIPLEEGTKVVTGNDGHIKMTLPDNTTFTVGPNTDLVIDKFVYDPDKSPEKVMATMTKGVFRWATGNKTVYKEPGQMKVNLPVVAVGIRGTDFETTVAPDGSGTVVLNFGQLEITEKKTGFTFILNAGEKITFTADGSVSRPIKI